LFTPGSWHPRSPADRLRRHYEDEKRLSCQCKGSSPQSRGGSRRIHDRARLWRYRGGHGGVLVKSTDKASRICGVDASQILGLNTAETGCAWPVNILVISRKRSPLGN
jgi:hypothetical protein